jgi:hypothetical protein
MDTSEHEDERRICPTCGHSNIPGAAFCAQCGRTLDDGAQDDAQTTSVYAPIGGSGTAPDATWAAPTDDDTIIDVDPGQTTTFPVGGRFSFDDEPVSRSASTAYQPERSIRGLVLGIIAMMLIAAVIGLYVYSAWLSVSVRNTIDSWLPWVT